MARCNECQQPIMPGLQEGGRLPIKDGTNRYHPDCHEFYVVRRRIEHQQSEHIVARNSDLYPE